MIVWSIDAAKGIPEICDILVSTDDPAIADIALNSGALVPWLRPAELATDTASSADVALHALDWYESERMKVDGLLLLQPTSPFRQSETIACGIQLFCQHNKKSVVAISPAKSHPMWCFKMEGTTMMPFMAGGQHLRSQDLPPAYVINGAFYLLTPGDLRQYHLFYNDSTVPMVISRPEESIDIDTEHDWKIAEAFAFER